MRSRLPLLKWTTLQAHGVRYATPQTKRRCCIIAPTWGNYRRTTDFYREGSLIWLDVDTQLRSLSNGRNRSMILSNYSTVPIANSQRVAPPLSPRQLEDVVRALDAITASRLASIFNESRKSTNERTAQKASNAAAGNWSTPKHRPKCSMLVHAVTT